MNKQRGFISGEAKIDAHLLNWSSEGKQKGNEWESNPQYDVILASDCLFFKDFHVGLLETIRRLLLPNGTAILLQPPRHGTMRMFLDLCIDYFNVELFTDYCAQVTV